MREAALRRLPAVAGSYDDFVLECFSPDEEPFRLVLEFVRDDAAVLRHSFQISPGPTSTAARRQFGDLGEGRIRVYSGERRRAAPRLHLARLRQVRVRRGAERRAPGAAKVKVVAWDLDNTLWRGTLIEDGAEACVLARRPWASFARWTSAASSRPRLEERPRRRLACVSARPAKYFLHPAIGWGQKSESLRAVAEKLNLGLDSFAFIDDSPFERAEVEAALPMVRVYSEAQVGGLSTSRSSTSRTRRAGRRLPPVRQSGHVQACLATTTRRSCELRGYARVRPGVRGGARTLPRARAAPSNQLNLSTRRYSGGSSASCSGPPGSSPRRSRVLGSLRQYGIVGFAAVDERPTRRSSRLRPVLPVAEAGRADVLRMARNARGGSRRERVAGRVSSRRHEISRCGGSSTAAVPGGRAQQMSIAARAAARAADPDR